MNKKIIIAGAVLIVLGGGVWLWRGTQSSQEEETTSIEESVPTDTPEPTPEEPVFEKGDFAIKILNGSGKAGLAGTLKTQLEGADFKIEDVGNADSYDYKNTIIQAKSSVPDGFVKLLEEELSGKFGTVETETLDSEEEIDVVIIIGGQQEEETEAAPVKQTPTPTPTTTDSESTPEGELES